MVKAAIVMIRGELIEARPARCIGSLPGKSGEWPILIRSITPVELLP